MAIEARNRPLPNWFTRIRTGQLVLPRIQRFESWSHGEVVTLLDTVLRGRPLGAALVLEIGAEEPFVRRVLAGAPPPTEKTTEHLLDGQQRLTALWKALNDLYEDRTYFAVLDPEDEEDAPTATSVSRWMNRDRRFPLWADEPKEQFKRDLVPMRLLRPEVESAETRKWCDQATDSIEESRDLQDRVTELQSAVRQVNLPFLALPIGTPRHVAIDVFIKMNTTSVQLSAFDIVVAQMEAETGESLHDLVDSLRASVPFMQRYLDPSDFVLRVAALREGRSPLESSFERLNFHRLWEEWDEIESGVDGAVRFLMDEHIFDKDRLPTVAVLPVLAAIWSQMPQALDEHGQARTLLRQYLWRSFFTGRYERSAATAALQDYRGLVERLVAGNNYAAVPIFDIDEWPVAEVEEIARAPWPKLRNILARGILAVSLRGGGNDLADDTPASWESLQKREYHHLFPEALLRDDALLEANDINLALNCALVTWKTNRHISAKEPLVYLQERVARAPLGLSQIKNRLRSHTIPFRALNVGGYSALAPQEVRPSKIKADYQDFISGRARDVHEAALKLCSGQEWHGLEEYA